MNNKIPHINEFEFKLLLIISQFERNSDSAVVRCQLNQTFNANYDRSHIQKTLKELDEKKCITSPGKGKKELGAPSNLWRVTPLGIKTMIVRALTDESLGRIALAAFAIHPIPAPLLT